MHFETDARMSMIFVNQLRAILCPELLSEASINTRAISGITTITAFLFLELWKNHVTWKREKTAFPYQVNFLRGKKGCRVTSNFKSPSSLKSYLHTLSGLKIINTWKVRFPLSALISTQKLNSIRLYVWLIPEAEQTINSTT